MEKLLMKVLTQNLKISISELRKTKLFYKNIIILKNNIYTNLN